jgi:DNA-binding MarR family transcriptional regulator
MTQAADNTSGFLVERTAKKMKQSFQGLLRAFNAGVTVDQWILLQEIEQQPGLSQLELAQATFKDAPTVTRILDDLTRQGMLQRVADPSDRRRFNIVLTEQGKAIIEKVRPVVVTFRNQAWKGLSEKELLQLRHLLDKVFTNLQTLSDNE